MRSMKPDPLWTVRGVCRTEDVCLVIEASSDVAAETFASKRGIDVVVVTQALASEVAAAKLAGRLFRYTPEPRLRCFGRPVGHMQAACFVLCGLATMVLNLRAQHIPLKIFW